MDVDFVAASPGGVCGAGQTDSSGHAVLGEGSFMDLEGPVVEDPPV